MFDGDRQFLEGAGAANPDELAAADAASTAANETFEAIYKRVKAVTDEIAGTREAEFDAARIAADAAAEPALDTPGDGPGPVAPGSAQGHFNVCAGLARQGHVHRSHLRARVHPPRGLRVGGEPLGP